MKPNTFRFSQTIDALALQSMFQKLIYSAYLIVLVGCADNLWYQMKRANPYFRAEWKRDQELGTTFVQRLDELQLLESQLVWMPPEEKQAWAQHLERVIASDSSPEFRTRAVQIIAQIPGEAAVRGLNAASTDESEKVRLATCEGWRKLGGSEGRDMLLTMVNNSSETTSVRQAAIESLTDFAAEPEVRSTLSRLLDDRSPAIQYQVTRSLSKVTGQDFGGNLQSWKDFMQGKEVEEPKTSLASGILNRVKFW